MGQLLDPDLGVLPVGDVFVGRNPAPVRHRVVGNSDRPTVVKHKLGRKVLLARQSLGAPGRVAIGLFLDSSGCDEIVEQFLERPSYGYKSGRKSVKLDEMIVPHHQPMIAVIHREALRHIAESSIKVSVQALKSRLALNDGRDEEGCQQR